MAGKNITDAKSGTVQAPSAFQRLRKRMSDLATLDQTDKKTLSGESINAILEAETEEEMWDADELPIFNAQKLSGCAMQLRSFSVKYGSSREESEIRTPFMTDGGRQMYLLVEAVMLDNNGTHKKEIRLPHVGSIFTWNTSAMNIVGKMFWMLDHGWFDLDNEKMILVRIEGTKTQSGTTVEKLKEYTDANHARTVIAAVVEPESEGTQETLDSEPPF